MSDALSLTLYSATWVAVWWVIHRWRVVRYQKKVIEYRDQQPPLFEDSFGISFVLMLLVGIAVLALRG